MFNHSEEVLLSNPDPLIQTPFTPDPYLFLAGSIIEHLLRFAPLSPLMETVNSDGGCCPPEETGSLVMEMTSVIPEGAALLQFKRVLSYYKSIGMVIIFKWCVGELFWKWYEDHYSITLLQKVPRRPSDEYGIIYSNPIVARLPGYYQISVF